MRKLTTKKLFGYLTASAFVVLFILPVTVQATTQFEQVKPKLEIPIPTVVLSDLNASKQEVGVPWIAQYLTGVYVYAAGIAAFIAAVMLIVAGIKWATAGGNSQAVSNALTGIRNALIGLALVAGVTVILNAVNPELVSLKALQIEMVDSERLMLEKVGFADEKVFDGETKTLADTSIPDVPPDGRPPLEAKKMPISLNLDLYDDKNQFGHVVKGTTPRQRVHSICTSVIGKGSGAQDIKERAAAITRVWIIELISRNGGLYVRGQDTNGMCIPQWKYVRNVSEEGNKSLCIQEFGNERLGNDSDITIAAIIEGCKQVEAGRVANPELKKACRYGSPVYNLLRDGYRQCWCIPAWQAGFLSYDCTNFVVALSKCAMGVAKTNTAPLQADAIYALDTSQNYYRQFAGTFGFQPFDLFHAGGKTPGLADLVHSFMYIGGLGLTYEGQPLSWIEMGGGGIADRASKRTVITGITGSPKLNGMSSVGVAAHYPSKNYAATGWPGTDDKPQYSYMYRMLERAQGSYQTKCGGKPCLYMSDDDREKIEEMLGSE